MKTLKTFAALAAALLLATAAGAAEPTSAAGAFAATSVVAGASLMLNGAGSRYKAASAVYDVALYTRVPVHSAEALFALDGPKLLQLVVRRDIGTTEFGRMLVKGIDAANPQPAVMRQLAGLDRLGEMLGSSHQTSGGETFGFEYRPGVGTLLRRNGKAVGLPVADPGFFELVMRTWLGPDAVDGRLKADLLGQPLSYQAALRRG